LSTQGGARPRRTVAVVREPLREATIVFRSFGRRSRLFAGTRADGIPNAYWAFMARGHRFVYAMEPHDCFQHAGYVW